MTTQTAQAKRPGRTPMREQQPLVRAHNFQEVPLGYSDEEAMAEARRCLQCKKPLCVEGCPVNVRIPQFIKLIAEGKFAEGAQKIKETNALPAICGRVCPQETQCEVRCILGKKGEPVGVGNLERFCADFERTNNALKIPAVKPPNGKKVAIVGSGPAGLTVAGVLALEGFDVTIFEALHEAGGVLVYGIPEFRLPKAIVKSEIDYLLKLGVRLEKNFVVGKTASVDELLTEEGFHAIFVGSGAGLPSFLGVPNENAVGVYSANEYLTRTNLMKAYLAGSDTPIKKAQTVVTVGGGNVAMDSARTALRLGAEHSIIVYRRSEAEMPARIAEVHHAKQEGIEFNLLCNPTEILVDEKKIVCGIRCIRMELGEPDASGRRRPIEMKGSEFDIPCQAVVVAIGNKPNPLVPQTTPDIQTAKHGNIVVKPEDGRTSKKFVYAGGDIVSGAATVIEAMGAGKIAARSIIQDLLGAD